MSWKEDRDALIAQTMAFVQSVTGRRQNNGTEPAGLAALPDVEALDARPAARTAAARVAVKAAELPPSGGIAPHPIGPSDMASEIRARIAGFRAHQERFNRERDEYFSKTLAKLKATLDDMPQTLRSDK
jgi:hypothetical protein